MGALCTAHTFTTCRASALYRSTFPTVSSACARRVPRGAGASRPRACTVNDPRDARPQQKSHGGGDGGRGAHREREHAGCGRESRDAARVADGAQGLQRAHRAQVKHVHMLCQHNNEPARRARLQHGQRRAAGPLPAPPAHRRVFRRTARIDVSNAISHIAADVTVFHSRKQRGEKAGYTRGSRSADSLHAPRRPRARAQTHSVTATHDGDERSAIEQLHNAHRAFAATTERDDVLRAVNSEAALRSGRDATARVPPLESRCNMADTRCTQRRTPARTWHSD